MIRGNNGGVGCCVPAAEGHGFACVHLCGSIEVGGVSSRGGVFTSMRA